MTEKEKAILLKGEKLHCLNIGCGLEYIQGFINIDKNKEVKKDLELDLETAQLPFKNDSIEIIKASHVLEHINNYVNLIKEIYRVLKPNGVLYVRVPEKSCDAAYSDPTHVRYFVPASFYYLTEKRQKGMDTGGVGGLFNMEFIELILHNSGSADRGTQGKWFTEIECELTKIGQ
jgi:SAM-dependent methyltransferase